MEWTNLSRVAAPAKPLIEVEAAIAHCRANDSEDELITSLIEAATAFIDGPNGIGVALVTASWRMSLDALPSTFTIPLNPVQSVDAITYRDPDGEVQTLDPSTYYVDVDQRPAVVAFIKPRPAILRAPGAVKVEFTAGYGDDSSDVPADLRHAALLLISHWYENREAALPFAGQFGEAPLGVARILAKYRAA